MEVILDDASDRLSKMWSDQFVADMKYNRRRIGMLARPTTEQVIRTIREAATTAGAGGTVIFSVGHGATDRSAWADPSVGMVDLAPHQTFRITQEEVFYDFDIDGSGPGNSQRMSDQEAEEQLKTLSTPGGLAEARTYQSNDQIRQFRNDLQDRVTGGRKLRAVWERYQRIGEAIKNSGIGKVVFLTCKVGNSTTFVRKIANDWAVTIVAYKRQIALQQEPKGTKVRLFLAGDIYDTGTNTEDARVQMPRTDRYIAGSPIE